jgi:hypothetical protein
MYLYFPDDTQRDILANLNTWWHNFDVGLKRQRAGKFKATLGYLESIVASSRL